MRMKYRFLPVTAVLAAALLGLAVPPAQSEAPVGQRTASEKQTASQKQKQRKKQRQRVRRVAPVPEVLPPATVEQIQAATLAHLGTYQCDFGQSMTVQPSTRHTGYLEARVGKEILTLRPELTTTGALRMQDARGERLLLQIADKSMLMAPKLGKRLVDGCVHEAQRGQVKASGLLD